MKEIEELIDRIKSHDDLQKAQPAVVSFLRDCEDEEVVRRVKAKWMRVSQRMTYPKTLSRTY